MNLRTLSFCAIIAMFVANTALAQQPPNPGPPPNPGQRGAGPPPPAVQPVRELLARFDADNDKLLNAEERAKARTFVESETRSGPAPAGPAPGLAPSSPGVAIKPADVRPLANVPFYDTGVLRTVFIDFDNGDWEKDLAAFRNTDIEVPATVQIDGKTYRNVGMHFRGASSFSRVPAGSKRSLDLTLDYINEDQQAGGYRSLNFLNAFNDPTFMRTMIYSEIARKYLPAPKVNLVRVVIYGENWGLYASAQQFNRDFLRDFYNTTEGARWKTPGSPRGRAGLDYLGEDVTRYKELYDIKTKNDPARWQDLIRLTRVLNQTPPESLEAALEPILNVDGALRFLAVEAALSNSDGYYSRASDYNIYQDAKGKFHVLPHDMNEGLGIPGQVKSRAELDPLVAIDDATKPLRSKLLAVPALRQRYLGYVRDIAERWLDWKVIGPIVEKHRALIEAEVKKDTRKLYTNEAFDESIKSLQNFMELRRAFLLK